MNKSCVFLTVPGRKWANFKKKKKHMAVMKIKINQSSSTLTFCFEKLNDGIVIIRFRILSVSSIIISESSNVYLTELLSQLKAFFFHLILTINYK